MLISTVLFEAFTGLAAIIGFALIVAAFVTETPAEHNRIEWTLRRKSRS